MTRVGGGDLGIWRRCSWGGEVEQVGEGGGDAAGEVELVSLVRVGTRCESAGDRYAQGGECAVQGLSESESALWATLRLKELTSIASSRLDIEYELLQRRTEETRRESSTLTSR